MFLFFNSILTKIFYSFFFSFAAPGAAVSKPAAPKASGKPSPPGPPGAPGGKPPPPGPGKPPARTLQIVVSLFIYLMF